MSEEAEQSSADDPFGRNDLHGLAWVFWGDHRSRGRHSDPFEDDPLAVLPEEIRHWLRSCLPERLVTVAPVTLEAQALGPLLEAFAACIQRLSPAQESSGPGPVREAAPTVSAHASRGEPNKERTRPEVEIFTFGRFTICLRGQEVALPGRQGDTLCKALVCQPGRKAESSWLAEQLWPDSDGDQAASYLHNAVWTLRQALPEGMLLTHKATQSYQLVGQDRLWIDADAAISRIEEANALGRTTAEALPLLEQAVQSFRRGRFLAGLEETWIYARRLHLSTLKERALTWLVKAYRTGGKRQQAQSLLFEALCEDPANENLLRVLMHTLHADGMTYQARLAYTECVKALKHVQMEPEEATTALYEHLKRAPQVFDLAPPPRSVLPSLPHVASAERRSEEGSGEGSCEPILPEHECNGGQGSTALTRLTPAQPGPICAQESAGRPQEAMNERFAPGFPGGCFGLMVWGMRSE